LEKVRLYVLKGMQKNQIVFTGYIKPQQARILTFTDEYPPTVDRVGYQRPPVKKRINDFSKYIDQQKSGFVTPILLNSRVDIEFNQIDNDYGYIELPTLKCLSIVDGQHRTLGTIQYERMCIPIPFMLFNGLDVSIEEDLFITINREQKKVPMSHVRFIDRENDPISQIAIKLEQDPGSPWFQKVNLVGARGAKRPVSLDSLRNALKELFQSGELKILDFDQKYNIAKDFWIVVAKVWPEAWAASKNSLLRKSMGTLAISKLGGYLIPQCIERNNDFSLNTEKLFISLSKASHINWKNDGEFKGFSGRHGADLVKNELDLLIFNEV
jgi:DGQHR domain-containing protein